MGSSRAGTELGSACPAWDWASNPSVSAIAGQENARMDVINVVWR